MKINLSSTNITSNEDQMDDANHNKHRPISSKMNNLFVILMTIDLLQLHSVGQQAC